MANFGESLKRERELRDIPLRDIANATKINLRYLEALEANRFDKLPGGVFNKGFIRAYARFIGADGEALVQRYMEEQAEREAAVTSAMPTPERPGLMRPAQTPRRRAEPAPAGEAPSSTPITFAEGRAASAAVAAMASSRRGGGAAAVTAPFQTDTAGPQARLLLATTTVVAAFAALAVVVYLVRSVRHDARLPGASHDSAPAAAPGPADPALEVPQDGAPQGEADAAPEGAGPAAPDGASPETGPDKAIPPLTPPSPKPLPEVPRERDRTTPPVRVASPIPAPAQEPIKPPPRPSTAAAPAPAPADASPPPAAGPMTLLVQGVNPVMVQLGCDGVDRPARMLVAGEVVTLRCYSLVRISTEDAGAVRLTLDGAACPPLGSSGSRVEHYTIRAEDARAICPPGGAGGHGRR